VHPPLRLAALVRHMLSCCDGPACMRWARLVQSGGSAASDMPAPTWNDGPDRMRQLHSITPQPSIVLLPLSGTQPVLPRRRDARARIRWQLWRGRQQRRHGGVWGAAQPRPVRRGGRCVCTRCCAARSSSTGGAGPAPACTAVLTPHLASLYRPQHSAAVQLGITHAACLPVPRPGRRHVWRRPGRFWRRQRWRQRGGLWRR
jgi:hypothetical protein